MYEGFERQRTAMEPNQICDVHYEDLARDPVGEVRRVYAQLELGDFENIREPLELYLETQRDYRPNEHALKPEISAAIATRWGRYFEQYGYSASLPAASPVDLAAPCPSEARSAGSSTGSTEKLQ